MSLMFPNPNQEFIHLKLINVRQSIANDDLISIEYVVEMNTPFREVKRMFAWDFNVPLGLLGFFYDGVLISNEDTPSSLYLQDNAWIEVFQRGTPGGRFNFVTG